MLELTNANIAKMQKHISKLEDDLFKLNHLVDNIREEKKHIEEELAEAENIKVNMLMNYEGDSNNFNSKESERKTLKLAKTLQEYEERLYKYSKDVKYTQKAITGLKRKIFFAALTQISKALIDRNAESKVISKNLLNAIKQAENDYIALSKQTKDIKTAITFSKLLDFPEGKELKKRISDIVWSISSVENADSEFARIRHKIESQSDYLPVIDTTAKQIEKLILEASTEE